MKQENPQWLKRVNVTQMIYSYLIFKRPINEFLNSCVSDLNFDADQLKILEFALSQKNKIVDLINQFTKETWNFDRLNTVDQAILLTAIAESKILKTNKNIIINESIKTAKNFSENNSFEYINAILDKVIK